jgi:hypothetical protein
MVYTKPATKRWCTVTKDEVIALKEKAAMDIARWSYPTATTTEEPEALVEANIALYYWTRQEETFR